MRRLLSFKAWAWNDWWIRIFGYGLSLEPGDHWRPFSERHKLRRAWHTRWFCIKPLSPVQFKDDLAMAPPGPWAGTDMDRAAQGDQPTTGEQT